jgi:hypothetical protein
VKEHEGKKRNKRIKKKLRVKNENDEEKKKKKKKKRSEIYLRVNSSQYVYENHDDDFFLFKKNMR